MPDCAESFAVVIPNDPVVVQGDRRITWADFNRRADALAAGLVSGGLRRGDRVAQYLYNCPEYVESYVGALKASLIPVNTNYRYGVDELTHLWDDADAAAVVFHGSFIETLERVRPKVPGVRLWIWVDDGTTPCPRWAIPYEQLAMAAEPRTIPWERKPSDRIFLYTGGTTGRPKGVMWRQDRMIKLQAARLSEAGTLEAAVRHRLEHGGWVVLAAPPLMHGAGIGAAVQAMVSGGTAVLLQGHRFNAVELWDAVQKENVQAVNVVGDAHARPMLDALESHAGNWSLSSLALMSSAGAILSEPVKAGILRHLPELRIVDNLGSSEAPGGGVSISTASNISGTALFEMKPGTRVIGPGGHDIEPGSGEAGLIAVPGGAEGYHKDPEKSARTFPLIDGVRYTVAGDYATVEPDGSIRFLGRGSGCINTGGEKVFPEEVEEAIKTHPGVADALVVGLPDDRFGEAVTALVAPIDDISDAEVIDHLKTLIAPYKVPRRIVRLGAIPRLASGKPDYPSAREMAIQRTSFAPNMEDENV